MARGQTGCGFDLVDHWTWYCSSQGPYLVLSQLYSVTICLLDAAVANVRGWFDLLVVGWLLDFAFLKSKCVYQL